MEEFLKYAIQRVAEKVDDFVNDTEVDKKAEFYQGMSLAYKIVIETIQNSLDDSIDLSELGIDFDTDKVL
ncbi:MAG: hypothetical protein NC395_07125 [Prevotella sp.]|nr:hypothetical protein [Prevotella sp.]